jgi:ribosomal protein L40E
MSNTSGAKAIDLKWFGKLTFRQILIVVLAFVSALALTLTGVGASIMCFGMLIIAIILYMVPRMAGVNNTNFMTVVGAVFMVTAVLIGGMFLAPSFVAENDGVPAENDYFKDIGYTFSDNEVEISFTLSDKALESGGFPYFRYAEVVGVSFQAVNATFNKGEYLNETDGYTVTLDRDKLYAGYLVLATTYTTEDIEFISESRTSASFLTELYDGSITNLGLSGCFNSIVYTMIFFFLIMLFSNFMRSRVERTRQQMERDGRLYPQGYGRCKECDSLVLPGEINCRKCGAYIDRPEEMKPEKADFFECSECGAEVPSDAPACPKCGAEFDEDEFEVTHSDGTVEVTNETVVCEECGNKVPATASFCPRCGAKFKK